MAVGVIGMSVDDFDRLLPEEFGAIVKAWRQETQRSERAWLAGIRLHAAICVQPHCQKPIAPGDLFAIPGEMVDSPQAPKLTKEERRARLKALKASRGYE